MAIVEPLSPTPDGHRRLRLRSTSNNEPFHEITVSTALNGRVETSPSTAKKIAKVLKTTPRKLGLEFKEGSR